MPDLTGLTERQVTYLACALDAGLCAAQRNHTPPGHELRQLAAQIVLTVPSAVVDPSDEIKLPSLLDASGLRVAAVKSEARRMVATKFDCDGSGAASSITATLSASEAARIAGVSSWAIRKAAAAGRLVATKDRITGAWRITTFALDEWLEGRHG